jgi:hypothetical protein
MARFFNSADNRKQGVTHMTDQEKKLHRAELQVELEDAQSDLAHLQDQAMSMAGHIENVAMKLQHNAGLVPSVDDFDVEAELIGRLDLNQTLDIAAARNLIAEMRAARKKVYNLESRKRKLLNPAGLTIAS